MTINKTTANTHSSDREKMPIEYYTSSSLFKHTMRALSTITDDPCIGVSDPNAAKRDIVWNGNPIPDSLSPDMPANFYDPKTGCEYRVAIRFPDEKVSELSYEE